MCGRNFTEPAPRAAAASTACLAEAVLPWFDFSTSQAPKLPASTETDAEGEDAEGEAALTSSLDEWDNIHGMDVVPGATAKRSRLKLVNKDGARKKARPSNYKIPKKLNPRSMGELSERF